jgi:hypothetical protein
VTPDPYAPCECGAWPTPGDVRAGRCRICWNYRPAGWYLAKQRRERRARGWRALALAALYPLRVIAQLTHRFPEEGSR